MKIESLKIIGTAHVSQKSVEEVKSAILEEKPDVVAVELCANRYHRLMQEKMGIEEKNNISISDVIKENKVGLFLVSGFLTYMQKKIGDDLGVKPGAEMLAAIDASEEVGARVALIDRDISLTLKRALNAMSAWEKIKFTYGIIYSFFSGEDEIDDIESLKKGDALQEVMNYFQEMSPQAYKVLVDERDAYMSHKLLEIPEDNVIAVIGAGHKQGINNYLEHPENLPPLSSLLIEKKSGVPWIKILLSLIPISFIIIFILAFIRGINIQSGLIQFILLTGGLSFLGSILSGSKILSAVTAFLVAPITSLHPLIAAGWFAGLVEAKLRHVGSGDLVDFGKCEDLKDLWNNNLFRVLLVVAGANIGSIIGSFITIPQVILPLFGKLWGA
ncbi:hypothetical protein JCM15415_05490 [Methanobacterium movens]